MAADPLSPLILNKLTSLAGPSPSPLTVTAYNSASAYSAGALTTHEGKLYRAKAALSANTHHRTLRNGQFLGTASTQQNLYNNSSGYTSLSWTLFSAARATSDLAVGDLILVQFSGGYRDSTVTVSGGWTLLGSARDGYGVTANDAHEERRAIYYKTVTSSDRTNGITFGVSATRVDYPSLSFRAYRDVLLEPNDGNKHWGPTAYISGTNTFSGTAQAGPAARGDATVRTDVYWFTDYYTSNTPITPPDGFQNFRGVTSTETSTNLQNIWNHQASFDRQVDQGDDFAGFTIVFTNGGAAAAVAATLHHDGRSGTVPLASAWEEIPFEDVFPGTPPAHRFFGRYDPARAYKFRDTVLYSGTVYQAQKDLTAGSHASSGAPALTSWAPNAYMSSLLGGGGAGAPDVQTFTESAAWTKPDGATKVRVELWAGGGGGYGQNNGAAGQGAGGGGGYMMREYEAGELPSSVSITIGAAGNGYVNTTPTAGGNTTFGTLLTALGGQPGTSNGVGGRGGGKGDWGGGDGGGYSDAATSYSGYKMGESSTWGGSGGGSNRNAFPGGGGQAGGAGVGGSGYAGQAIITTYF